MSLVNDMLRDLEDRFSRTTMLEDAMLPPAVKAKKRRHFSWVVIWVAVMAAAITFYLWFFHHQLFSFLDTTERQYPTAKAIGTKVRKEPLKKVKPKPEPKQADSVSVVMVSERNSPRNDKVESVLDRGASSQKLVDGRDADTRSVIEQKKEEAGSSTERVTKEPESRSEHKRIVEEPEPGVARLAEEPVDGESSAELKEPHSVQADRKNTAVKRDTVASLSKKKTIKNSEQSNKYPLKRQMGGQMNTAKSADANSTLRKKVGKSVPLKTAKVKTRHVATFERAFAKAKKAWSLNNMANAEIALREALKLNSEHLQSRIMLATLLLNAKRYPEVLEITHSAPTFHLRNQNIALIHARALDGVGRSAESLVFLQKFAGSINNPSIDILRLQGVLLQRLGRNAESAVVYERIVKMNPEDAQSWAGLGIAHDAVGDSSKAMFSYKRALEIGSLPFPLIEYLQERVNLLTKGENR